LCALLQLCLCAHPPLLSLSLTLQVAVQKFVKLTLLPASSTLVTRATPASQVIKLDNSQHGAKSIALRIKVTYSVGGEKVEEMVDFKAFPAGF
jgi:AP-1 complex subunit gamma-1